MTLNQRRTFLVAFGGVLVASRMYVSTSALLSCYERVFCTKKSAYFMISEYWTFGLHNLFVRTREPFFSNLRTVGLKNLRTHEPSNLRTFGLIGCNRFNQLLHHSHRLCPGISRMADSVEVSNHAPIIGRLCLSTNIATSVNRRGHLIYITNVIVYILLGPFRAECMA